MTNVIVTPLSEFCIKETMIMLQLCFCSHFHWLAFVSGPLELLFSEKFTALCPGKKHKEIFFVARV